MRYYFKKIHIYIFIVCLVIGLFIKIDKNRYFVGKSYFDYKLLPHGLQPKFHSHSYKKGNRMKYEFQIVANGFEGYGEGTSCFSNKDMKGCFTIKRIEGYYYSKEFLFVHCYDSNDKIHYITPFVHGKTKDVLLIDTIISENKLKMLKYIKVPEPISVKEYNENYNFISRILLWLKL